MTDKTAKLTIDGKEIDLPIYEATNGPDVVDVGGLPLRILPLLMALSMFVQQKMTMKDPKQAALVYIMPLVLIFFFWSMSSITIHLTQVIK